MDRRPGPHLNIFAPVMDHGIGKLGPLFNEKFGKTQMKAGLQMFCSGTSCNDMDIRILLHNDQIMNILGKTVFSDMKAGLKRFFSTHPFFNPYEKTLEWSVNHGPGNLILIPVQKAPEKRPHLGKLLFSLGNAHDIHTVHTPAAVENGVILLNKSAGT